MFGKSFKVSEDPPNYFFRDIFGGILFVLGNCPYKINKLKQPSTCTIVDILRARHLKGKKCVHIGCETTLEARV
jgi:hypothetical protein